MFQGRAAASPAPRLHVRQLLHRELRLRQPGLFRPEPRVQQLGVGAQRQTQAGPEGRLQVLRCQSVKLPLPHQDRDGDAAWRQQLERVQALLPAGPLHLVAVVLEPDLHLVRGETDEPSQVFPLRGRQVALLPEAALELERLRLREEDASLPAAALLRGAPDRDRAPLCSESGRSEVAGRLQGQTLNYRERGGVIRLL